MITAGWSLCSGSDLAFPHLAAIVDKIQQIADVPNNQSTAVQNTVV